MFEIKVETEGTLRKSICVRVKVMVFSLQEDFNSMLDARTAYTEWMDFDIYNGYQLMHSLLWVVFLLVNLCFLYLSIHSEWFFSFNCLFPLNYYCEMICVCVASHSQPWHVSTGHGEVQGHLWQRESLPYILVSVPLFCVNDTLVNNILGNVLAYISLLESHSQLTVNTKLCNERPNKKPVGNSKR